MALLLLRNEAACLVPDMKTELVSSRVPPELSRSPLPRERFRPSTLKGHSPVYSRRSAYEPPADVRAVTLDGIALPHVTIRTVCAATTVTACPSSFGSSTHYSGAAPAARSRGGSDCLRFTKPPLPIGRPAQPCFPQAPA